MEIVIWLVGLAIPVAILLFLFGYLKGSMDAYAIYNWGTGFDDGWKAHKEFAEEIKGYNDNATD